MSHKYPVGAGVYLQTSHMTNGARGLYKVVRHMPVERDSRILYRVRNETEMFERTVEEDSLSKERL